MIGKKEEIMSNPKNEIVGTTNRFKKTICCQAEEHTTNKTGRHIQIKLLRRIWNEKKEAFIRVRKLNE